MLGHIKGSRPQQKNAKYSQYPDINVNVKPLTLGALFEDPLQEQSEKACIISGECFI